MSRRPRSDADVLTTANAVTVTRLVLAVPWVLLVHDQGAGWLSLGLGVLLAGSDGFDGWIARRHGATRSGAFLDPLADKVLVLGGLWALVLRDRFWALPVLVITGREVLMSLWRSYAGRRGLSVPARPIAKVKTVVQQAAIGLALAPPLVDAPRFADAVLWVGVALAVWSGADYLRDAGRALREDARR